MLDVLSAHLRARIGRGYSGTASPRFATSEVANLAQGFSSRLSWTHYRALLKVSDPAARACYEIEAEREKMRASSEAVVS